LTENLPGKGALIHAHLRRLATNRHEISGLTAANARITVITKPPENYPEKDQEKINDCIELLMRHNITVKTKDRIHQKFAVIDQRIVWYGSINLLSYGASEESIMRIESMDIAAELAGMA